MKVYTPKGLIHGHKLGKDFLGKVFVAVPQNKVDRGYCVAYNNKVMPLVGLEPDLRLKFNDQYGRKPYWLYYYEWKGITPVIGDCNE